MNQQFEKCLNKNLSKVELYLWREEGSIEYIKLIFSEEILIFSIGSTGEDLVIINEQQLNKEIARRGGLQEFEIKHTEISEIGFDYPQSLIRVDVTGEKLDFITELSLQFDSITLVVLAKDDCLDYTYRAESSISS